MNHCIASGETLESLPLEEYRKLSPVFEADVYDFIDLTYCVEQRQVPGGPARQSVADQISDIRTFLEERSEK